MAVLAPCTRRPTVPFTKSRGWQRRTWTVFTQTKNYAGSPRMKSCADFLRTKNFEGSTKTKNCADSPRMKSCADLPQDEELRGFAEDEELRGLSQDEELRGTRPGLCPGGCRQRAGRLCAREASRKRAGSSRR